MANQSQLPLLANHDELAFCWVTLSPRSSRHSWTLANACRCTAHATTLSAAIPSFVFLRYTQHWPVWMRNLWGRQLFSCPITSANIVSSPPFAPLNLANRIRLFPTESPRDALAPGLHQSLEVGDIGFYSVSCAFAIRCSGYGSSGGPRPASRIGTRADSTWSNHTALSRGIDFQYLVLWAWGDSAQRPVVKFTSVFPEATPGVTYAMIDLDRHVDVCRSWQSTPTYPNCCV